MLILINIVITRRRKNTSFNTFLVNSKKGHIILKNFNILMDEKIN